MENKWHNLPGDWSIKAKDLLADDAKCIPCKVFFNTTTGELRMFSTRTVEEKGMDFFTDFLNQPTN